MDNPTSINTDRTLHEATDDSAIIDGTAQGGRLGNFPTCVLNELPPGAFRVYIALCAFRDMKTGVAWPSHAALAQMAGVSMRHVRHSLAELAEGEWITYTPGDGRRGSFFGIPDPCGKCYRTKGGITAPGGEEPQILPRGNHRSSVTLKKTTKRTDPSLPVPRQDSPEPDPEEGGGEDFVDTGNPEKEQTTVVVSRKRRSIEEQDVYDLAGEYGWLNGDDADEAWEFLKGRGIEEARKDPEVDHPTHPKVWTRRVRTILEDHHIEVLENAERDREKLDDLRHMGADYDTIDDWYDDIETCKACDGDGQVHLVGMMIWPPQSRNLTTRDDPDATWSDRCPHTAEWREAAG